MNTADKERLARKVRCPKCNTQPFMSCKTQTRTQMKTLKHPHKERIEAALAEED